MLEAALASRRSDAMPSATLLTPHFLPHKEKADWSAGMPELLRGHRGGTSKRKDSVVGAIRAEISGIKVIDLK